MRYNIDTKVIDKDIISTVSTEDPMEVITRKIIRTQDDQIRQALITLGWTPPKEKEDERSPVG